MIWSEGKNLRTAPHAFLMVWWPTYPSPNDWLTGLFRTEEPAQFNLSHYSDPEFDLLVAEGAALEAVEREVRSNGTAAPRRSWCATRWRSSSATSTIASSTVATSPAFHQPRLPYAVMFLTFASMRRPPGAPGG